MVEQALASKEINAKERTVRVAIRDPSRKVDRLCKVI